jgi:diguanylate cyclase (GGDEF)-like protein
MDLDLFTAYNDHYGPAAGDRCLSKIASCLADLVQRPGDLIARYGRGGFACVLPETDTLGAVAVAERFRAEVFGLGLPHQTSNVGTILTASLGVATGVPLNGAEPEDLLTLAERHLFDAKRAGRNRVVFGS